MNKLKDRVSWVSNFGYMTNISRSEMVVINTGLAIDL